MTFPKGRNRLLVKNLKAHYHSYRSPTLDVMLKTGHFNCHLQNQFPMGGIPRNFVWGGGLTNSDEDRENGDLGVVAP